MVICLQIPDILNRWKNYFSKLLLNVHNEPLVPGASRLQVEIAIGKKYKSPGSDEIIIVGYHCYHHTKFYQVSSSQDKVRTWMKLLGTINYWSDCLHLSDTAEKMGVQLDSTSTSAIHRLQERL
jgi:hypothetical protein